MLSSRFLLLVGALVAATGAMAETPTPDTVPGRTLAGWLAAFNSGDRATMERFLVAHVPKRSVDEELAFRAQTGGFDLLAVEKSEAGSIVFRVREKSGPNVAIGKFEASGEPAQMSNFTLRIVPPDFRFVDVRLDGAARRRAIDGASRLLDEYYVFADAAKRMGGDVQARLKHGDYDNLVDPDAFADKVTADLRAISHDRHLQFAYDPKSAAPPEPAGADSPPQHRRTARRDNCGFRRVEQLPGNIGYLKFDMFADADECGPVAVAAMNFLADTDALIVDLRENGGGQPAMIALVSSFLFDHRTHLNDLYNRKEDTTVQFWTLPYVPGRRFGGDKPVWVLTSHDTFSGAEEFSYNLKALKRATLVGETTGGGAHPVGGHRIDDWFTIDVPFARAINPLTKTNWEGTGVEPDVKVAAGGALAEARRLAEGKLRERRVATD
jgi:hypothetical protein